MRRGKTGGRMRRGRTGGRGRQEEERRRKGRNRERERKGIGEGGGRRELIESRETYKSEEAKVAVSLIRDAKRRALLWCHVSIYNYYYFRASCKGALITVQISPAAGCMSTCTTTVT